jgi:transposase-like protein
MGGSTVTREDRTTYWKKLVQAQAESGLSAAAFCKDHQVNPQRFYSWRRRFKDESDASKGGDAFLELVPSSKTQASGIRVRLDERLSIELERHFDPHTLRNAIEALCGQGSCWR